MSAVTCKNGPALERVRFFPRQLITADDMTAEQQYFRQKQRRHNRYLHGWGVVCGMVVEPAVITGKPWRVRLCPGYAVGPQGDEILVSEPVLYDLVDGTQEPQDPCAQAWPCPPTGARPGNRDNRDVFLAIRYAECDTRPTRVHPCGCGCDETACEYSRTRDSFEVRVLWDLPQSHLDAAAADTAWCQQVGTWASAVANPANNSGRGPMPVPPCAPCPEEPWVVVARIALPPDTQTPITAPLITYFGRRVLLSVQSLTTLTLCLP